MATLTDAQLANLVVKYWPMGVVPQTGESRRATAFAVCLAESGARTDALGDAGCSIGLFQIDTCFAGRPPAASLYDPDVNASFAAQLSGGGVTFNDWCSWRATACGGYGNGSYAAYLGRAAAALAVYNPPPPPPPVPPPPAPPPVPPPVIETAVGEGAVIALASVALGAAIALRGYESAKRKGKWHLKV